MEPVEASRAAETEAMLCRHQMETALNDCGQAQRGRGWGNWAQGMVGGGSVF